MDSGHSGLSIAEESIMKKIISSSPTVNISMCSGQKRTEKVLIADKIT